MRIKPKSEKDAVFQLDLICGDIIQYLEKYDERGSRFYRKIKLQEISKYGFVESCEELINIYLIFKNNLFLIAKKLMDLDIAVEEKGLNYLTYEQIINTITFHYFHLYCIYFDAYTLCMQDADREQFLLTLDRFEYLKERSISTTLMLLEANEVTEIKISSGFLELLEKDYTIERYRKILDMHGRNLTKSFDLRKSKVA